MFVHIAPEHDAIGETISTLKFAERVSSVELGAARANKENSDVKELKEQVFILTSLSPSKPTRSLVLCLFNKRSEEVLSLFHSYNLLRATTVSFHS